MSPASVFILESGGLDSLVALTPLLRAMNRAWPNTRITAGCRQAFTGVESLWPAKAAAVSVGNEPGAAAGMSRDLVESVSRTLATLQAVKADWFICAEKNPGWFARVVGSWFGAQRSIYLGAEPPEGGLASVLIRELTLSPVRFEWDSPEGLKLEIEPEPALWTLPARVREAALERLEQLGLREKHYLACVPESRWGLARYGEAIEAIRIEQDIPVLILWDGASPPGPAVRCHQPANLASAAALLVLARAYLTGDSGHAALAHAYGLAGAALRGGGDVPGPVPSISHPLPCSGCGWDCLFAGPVCMDLIPVLTVARQAREAFAGAALAPVELDALTPMELALIARAGAQYRAVTAENRRCQTRLIEIQYELENSRPRRR